MSFFKSRECSTGELHDRTRNPKIVPRDEWEQARVELLVSEKAHTHAGDELAAARRRLPMTRMEPVTVIGRSGPVPLADVFEGRRTLIVYHEGA